MTHMQRVEILTRLYAEEFKGRVGIGIAYEVTFLKLWDQLRELFSNATVYFGMGNDVYECFLASKEYYAEIGRNWSENEEKKLLEVGKHCLVFGRQPQGEVLLREIVTEKTDECNTSLKVVDKAGSWNSLRKSEKKLSDSDKPPVGTTVDGNEDVTVVRQVTTAGTVSVPPEFFISSSHIRTRVAEIRNSTPKDKLQEKLHAELGKLLPSKVVDFISHPNTCRRNS